MVGKEVDEEVGPEDEPVVEPGVGGQQTGEHCALTPAREGEGVDLIGERGALTDDPLIGVPRRKSGRRLVSSGWTGAQW